MRSPLVDTTGNEVYSENCEQIIKNLDFLGGVQYVNQLITPDIILPIIVESIDLKATPKKNSGRAPLTTAPLPKMKRPELRTSSVNKKQGNTTTTFFQRKKNGLNSSPKAKESARINKPQNSKQIGKLSSGASNHYHKKSEEEKTTKEEDNSYKNSLQEIRDEEQQPIDFHHLTNYRDNDEIMSNSIEEEIEIDSCQQEGDDYNNGFDLQPEHNYFPQELNKEEEAPKPTFFSQGISQATQYRPYTPPFAGLSSMKNINTSDKEIEEEVVELVYDPTLECYYDPTTMEYYKVNE